MTSDKRPGSFWWWGTFRERAGVPGGAENNCLRRDDTRPTPAKAVWSHAQVYHLRSQITRVCLTMRKLQSLESR